MLRIIHIHLAFLAPSIILVVNSQMSSPCTAVKLPFIDFINDPLTAVSSYPPLWMYGSGVFA